MAEPENHRDKQEDKGDKRRCRYYYWNCAKGFAKKAVHIQEILKTYDPHILFIAECGYLKTTKKGIDTKVKNIEESLNYKTFYSSTKKMTDYAQILAFVKEDQNIIHLRSEFVEEENSEMIVFAHHFNDQVSISQTNFNGDCFKKLDCFTKKNYVCQTIWLFGTYNIITGLYNCH